MHGNSTRIYAIFDKKKKSLNVEWRSMHFKLAIQSLHYLHFEIGVKMPTKTAYNTVF